jgi:hypothetical protein
MALHHSITRNLFASAYQTRACSFARLVPHARSIARAEWEPFRALAPCDAQVVSASGLASRHDEPVDPLRQGCKPAEGQSLAVGGEVVELNARGDGDEGELATRPSKPSRST